MGKNKHSDDYNKSFKDVKKHLPLVYIDAKNASQVLKPLGKFYLFLEYFEFGIYPRFLAKGKTHTADISDFISLNKTEDSLAIGYKRQDELLDLNGKRFSKSKKVQRTLEYVQCDRSWVKWTLFRIALLFKK